MKTLFKLLLLSLALQQSAAQAADVQATVLSVSGNTQYYSGGGSGQALKMGTMLAPGTRISTDQKGLVILLLADGSKLSLGPNTDLTLTEMTKESDSYGNVFNLLRGLIRASVQKLTVGSKFEVASAHGVAAVKGTEFEAEAGDAGMEVRCSEGKVWLSDLKRERVTEITKDMKARCFRERPERCVPMLPEDRERFGRWAQEPVSEKLHREFMAAMFWDKLRPDQKLTAIKELREDGRVRLWDLLNAKEQDQARDTFKSQFSELVSEFQTLTVEERQERWRERLRDVDERNLASGEAQVDFSLRKSTLDRQGRRVRFNEFLLRPAPDQVQFLNYSKRDNRTDLLNVVNTYNKALPHDLNDARDINQKVWFQVAQPQWWVTNSTVVFANSSNDSLAGATWFFDPVRTVGSCGCVDWELPVQRIQLGLNLPDIAHPILAGSLNLGSTGILLEQYDRYDALGLGTNQILSSNVAYAATSPIGSNSISTAAAMGSNLKWTGGIGFSTLSFPVVSALTDAQLGVSAGDLAGGERRSYADGTYVDIRSYAIDENGKVANLPDLAATGFANTLTTLAFKTYQEINISSNRFAGLGDIDIISQMMWWYTITKRADQI